MAFCIKCGSKLPEGAAFCMNCGTKVQTVQPNPAAAPAQPDVPAQPEPPARPVAPAQPEPPARPVAPAQPEPPVQPAFDPSVSLFGAAPAQSEVPAQNARHTPYNYSQPVAPAPIASAVQPTAKKSGGAGKVIAIVLAVLLVLGGLGVGGYFFFKNKDGTDTEGNGKNGNNSGNSVALQELTPEEITELFLRAAKENDPSVVRGAYCSLYEDAERWVVDNMGGYDAEFASDLEFRTDHLNYCVKQLHRDLVYEYGNDFTVSCEYSRAYGGSYSTEEFLEDYVGYDLDGFSTSVRITEAKKAYVSIYDGDGEAYESDVEFTFVKVDGAWKLAYVDGDLFF